MRFSPDLLLSLVSIFQWFATSGRARASVMRPSDGSAMRKWMGFHKGEWIYEEEKIVLHANMLTFHSACLKLRFFFFDSHAMRTTFSVRCHASRVENWSLIYWIIKHVYFRSSSLLDFTPYMMCGLMHFASKGKTISSTNPWSTHAVDLAPKADPTTPRIPLGLWAIKVTGEGLNSKFASHGEKRLYE